MSLPFRQARYQDLNDGSGSFKESYIYRSLPTIEEDAELSSHRRRHSRLETLVLTVSLGVFILLGFFILMQIIADATKFQALRRSATQKDEFGHSHPFH